MTRPLKKWWEEGYWQQEIRRAIEERRKEKAQAESESADKLDTGAAQPPQGGVK